MPLTSLPLISGTLLSFARAIGEFGAIVVVAGNIPLHSQTAAVYVLGEIESENRSGFDVESRAGPREHRVGRGLEGRVGAGAHRGILSIVHARRRGRDSIQ